MTLKWPNPRYFLRLVGSGLPSSWLGPFPPRHADKKDVSPSAPKPVPEGPGGVLRAVAETYAEFGEHRTGSAADKATLEWLGDGLRSAGMVVVPHVFRGRVYEVQQRVLKIDGEAVECFPLWLPRATGPEGLKGTLSLFAFDDPKQDLSGKIVLVPFRESFVGAKSDHVAFISESARRGAIGVIGAAIGAGRSDVLALDVERPFNQVAWPLPVVCVPPARLATLIGAARKEAPCEIVIDGVDAPGAEIGNLLARIERTKGGKWIVLSTDLSAWFSAGAQRGAAIGLMVDLARRLNMRGEAINLCCVAASGAELGRIGLEAVLASPDVPPAAETLAWIHLGDFLGKRGLPLRLHVPGEFAPLLQPCFALLGDVQYVETPDTALNLPATKGFKVIGVHGMDVRGAAPETGPLDLDGARLEAIGDALNDMLERLSVSAG